MNEGNLIDLRDRTPEERRAISSKGGTQKAENARKRRLLREELEELMASGDTQRRISTALVDAALNGSVSAFTAIRDTLGQKPTDRLAADVTTAHKLRYEDLADKKLTRHLLLSENVDGDIRKEVRDMLTLDAKEKLVMDAFTEAFAQNEQLKEATDEEEETA